MSSSNFNILIMVCLAAYVGMLTFIGMREAKKAQASFNDYAVAGKGLPSIVVALTVLATALGASDMIAHADSSSTLGFSWVAWPLGENLAKAAFALLAGSFIAKQSLRTIADFVEKFIVNDKITKFIVGALTSIPGMAWVGAQSMAIGAIFNMFTGYDPAPAIIISTLIFVAYTAAGGMHAVAKVDAVQSSVIFTCAALFYFTIFKQFDFSLANLKEMSNAVDPNLFDLSSLSPGRIMTLVITPLLGVSVAQFYWQRLYAAKDPRSAKNSFAMMAGVAFVICICTIISGIYARTINPALATESGAMPFLVKTVLPQWLQLLFIVAIIAATLSSADSLLNSSALTIVNDCIMPFKKLSDKQAVRYATIATVVVGGLSLLFSLSFTFILRMIEMVYGGVGGALVPLLLIGMFWRKDASAGFSVNNSKVTPAAARIGLVLGLVVGITFSRVPELAAIMGGGTFPAIIVSCVSYLGISMVTKKEMVDDVAI